MDRTPEQNIASTTVVLAAPPSGVDFDQRYEKAQLGPAADQQTIDIPSAAVGKETSDEGGPGWGVEPSDS